MNTKFKGTPGPWAFAKSRLKGLYPKDFISIHSEGYNLNEDDYVGSNAGKTSICGIWGKLNYETIANARLIAAAPELLEALQHSNDIISRLDLGGDYINQYRDNIEVIKKALGE